MCLSEKILIIRIGGTVEVFWSLVGTASHRGSIITKICLLLRAVSGKGPHIVHCPPPPPKKIGSPVAMVRTGALFALTESLHCELTEDSRMYVYGFAQAWPIKSAPQSICCLSYI